MASLEPRAFYYITLMVQEQGDEQQQLHPNIHIMPIRCFEFLIRVIRRYHSISPHSTLISIPVMQSSATIGCKRFFREGKDFLRRQLSNPYLTHEELDHIIEGAMSEVQELFEGLGSQPAFAKPWDSCVLPLALDIVVDMPPHNEREQQVTMIPASQEAIHSLKKLKLTKLCNICLEEFGLDDGVEVSVMPCNHVFHHHCTVSWLETSHTCPLCRYPMPTAATAKN